MSSLLASLILALAAPQAQFTRARADFKKALSKSDPVPVYESGKRLAATGKRSAVTVLLDGVSTCTGKIRTIWTKKTGTLRAKQQSADFRIIMTAQGPTVNPADAGKFRRFEAAEKTGVKIESEIMLWETCQRGIIMALREIRSDEAVAEMVKQLTKNSNWQKKVALAIALGALPQDSISGGLATAVMEDLEPQVRIAAIESIEERGVATADIVDALLGQMNHKFWQVRYVAARTLATLGVKQAVGSLIDALAPVEGRLRDEINTALTRLTGVDKHGDPGAWKAWWEANSAAYLDGTYEPAPGEKAGGGPKVRTTFYGIPIKSRNLVFILDRSGSMFAPSDWKIPKDMGTGPALDPAVRRQGDRKIDIARWQLKRALAMLPDGTQFNILFYNHDWTVLSKHHMLRLSATTRKRAYTFIDSVDPMGPTNIFDPLEKGLSYAASGSRQDLLARSGVDTIFFLSDGMPNMGQIPVVEGILIKVQELNRARKVKIHTIGVFSKSVGPAALNEELDLGSRFLKDLAAGSGGSYTGSEPRADPQE